MEPMDSERREHPQPLTVEHLVRNVITAAHAEAEPPAEEIDSLVQEFIEKLGDVRTDPS